MGQVKEGDDRGAIGRGKSIQSHGSITKPVWGESWVLMGKGIRERKMGKAGAVKNLICHYLEGEAEPLRSGPSKWAGYR